MVCVNYKVLRRQKMGFTLIELLAAMAVLVLIVLLMSRVFTETMKIWQLGTKRITAASEGRAVMDFLVREMSMAIADDVVSFRLISPGLDGQSAFYGVRSYGADSDEICFTAMVRPGSSDRRRTANQFAYFIAPMLDEKSEEMPNRYRLVRTRRTSSMYKGNPNRQASAYGDPDWWRGMTPDRLETGVDEDGNTGLLPMETIAENVAAFEIWAFSEAEKDYKSNFDSMIEGEVLPLWVDIYLEVLGEDEAVRAAILWGSGGGSGSADARQYIDNNVRRFTARVFFPNRERALAFRNP